MNILHTPYRLFFWLAIGLISMLTACQDDIKPKSLFTELNSTQTGIDFINQLPYNHLMNNMVYDYYYNGGGVAAGDINNDGLPDLYFTANLLPDKLYLNKGDFKFEDITSAAGILHTKSWTTGVSMIDINADGLLDIYVCKSGRLSAGKRANQLYINKGNQTFKEEAKAFGLNSSSYSTQAAFLDFDLDGDLDCFLLNHPIKKTTVSSFEKARAQLHELGGDQLFENQNGKFVDISRNAGLISNPLSFGLGVSIGDLNADGWPDIFVTNDYSEPDYLYYNNRNGSFTEVIKEKTNQISNFSMGNDMADFNNDGRLDLVTAEMSPEDNYSIKTSMSGMNPEQFGRLVEQGMHYQYMYNTLQSNLGNGHFSEVGQLARVANTGWSWAPLFADFDLDGRKDLYITNGYKRDNSNNDFLKKFKAKSAQFEQSGGEDTIAFMSDIIEDIPEVHLNNYMFKNNGNFQFDEVTETWGLNVKSFSTGAAYADLDNDGDLDLIVNNVDEPAQVFENHNEVLIENNYLKVSLVGGVNNPNGIGAKVGVYYDGKGQYLEQYFTRGYQSSTSADLIFGLGLQTHVDSVLVIWPSGVMSRAFNVKSNQKLKIDFADSQKNMIKTNMILASGNLMFSNEAKPFFQDITESAGLHYKHVENDYNDFETESLLPHKMSEFGPGLATGDVNGDGLEDFYVGGAVGFSGALFIQNIEGKFEQVKSSLWEKEKGYEDVDALLFDTDGDSDLDLYVVSGGNEFDADSKWLQDRLYLNDGQGRFSKSTGLAKMLTSGSCVKANDFDHDGDLDIFIGGRQIPGQYPLPATSYLLENKNGKFINATAEKCPSFIGLGMVTDAVWTDFNSDGQSDLILVGEWMSPRFFQNDKGSFTDVTDETGLKDQVGWWFSISQADFDQDGDMDYVLGNLGLNYKYKASIEEPFNIYAKDFDESGNLDIVLGYYNNGNEFPLRGRECTSNQMPFIKEKFPSYHDFGSANISDVYGQESLASSLHYSATQFASIYVENLGEGKFSSMELPIEAQFSSVNQVLIRDVNSDSQLDIIIAGNLYQSEVETPRNDASYGLCLLGNGQGEFNSSTLSESGLFIKGDVKAMDWINVNGKSTILVGKNNDQLQLIQCQR